MILSSAEIFFKTLSFLKQEVYTRQKIIQIVFLLKDKNSRYSENSFSRFSRIVAFGSSAENSSVDSKFLDAMLDCAIELGIVANMHVFQYFCVHSDPNVISYVDFAFWNI